MDMKIDMWMGEMLNSKIERNFHAEKKRVRNKNNCTLFVRSADQ